MYMENLIDHQVVQVAYLKVKGINSLKSDRMKCVWREGSGTLYVISELNFSSWA